MKQESKQVEKVESAVMLTWQAYAKLMLEVSMGQRTDIHEIKLQERYELHVLVDITYNGS